MVSRSSLGTGWTFGADWTQGWPAGWTVGGLLGSGLPSSCQFITWRAPDGAPSLQCCYPSPERGAPGSWVALRMPGVGLCQCQKPQQTLTLANGGHLEMDLFSFWLE